ncbi:hypothetical protein HP1_013 [Candidatus Termititenax spirochaetophilus]|uniref:PEGA domain-containing protein n=1 Tax=Candidatus Termititenax spirochaetophilus TaxID=2218522 RepID=A0A388T6C9_9BACT|nr:hypothetical protein HP1_013 [Candidatus Termititenax spirochaetophilus]
MYRNGLALGKIEGTEQSFKLKRDKGDVVLTFRKAGYQDNTIVLQRDTDPWYWGNYAFGLAAAGGGVSELSSAASTFTSVDDLFTGNKLQYSPNQYYIEMVKL